MSGIAGILHFDGSPVDADLLHEMTDAMAHRGPDGAGYWTEGPIGLGHRQFVTTPEALRERQPHHDAAARLCLTFDGRLDNREELATALRGKGVLLRDDTDAELVLRAYEVWGEESPQRLLGDFAYAIWDGVRRRLFCARDIMGIRPFHFFHGSNFVGFASELHALFRDLRVRPAPNEGMVAEYLALQMINPQETLFKGIDRLPMGHCLSIDANGCLRMWRYWDVDFTKRLSCRTDAEYAEHFLEIMRESVRCRLRTNGPIGSELSGGQDSSTVSVMAKTLLGMGEGDITGFQTYSIVYPNLPCDESGFIKDIHEFASIPGKLFEREELPSAHYPAVVAKYREFPGYPNGDAEVTSMAAALKGNGCRTALTGQGGNEWLEGSLDYLADLVSDLHFLHAWRDAWRSRKSMGCSAARLLYRHALRPLWRDSFGAGVRRDPLIPWIRGPWAEQVGLPQRLVNCPPHPGGGSRVQVEMYRRTLGADEVHCLEVLDKRSLSEGFEYRHPMLDRRMIEFAYALPGDQRWRDGRPKTVLTNAMKGQLPSSVLDRSEQAEFTAVVVAAVDQVRAKWPMREWTVGKLGWVDVESLEQQYDKARERFKESGSLSWYFRGAWVAFGISEWANQEVLRTRDGL